MTEHSASDRTSADSQMVDRRHVLGVGAGVGVTLLAGCTSQTDNGTSGDDTSDEGSSGTFRLLISDQPVAIDDFDSLDVSFDSARIFRGESDDDEEAEEEDDSTDETEETNETETETDETDETNETETNETETADSETEEIDDDSDDEEAESDDEEDEEDEEDDGDSGFSTIDLDGATVDLTEVVGDKAIGVFEGELEAGRYSKIELYASNVTGVVDGETVGVKIPSGKLQIVKPFEITADEPVSFVFDINVVKKGRTGEYNLLPVISGSGVAGKDVDVEEIDDDDEDESEDDEDESEADNAAGNETDTDDSDENGSNSPDTSGNETSVDEQ